MVCRKARDEAVEELRKALEGPFNGHTVTAMAAFRNAHEALVGGSPVPTHLARLRAQALALEQGYAQSARELFVEYTKTYATYHNGTLPSYVEDLLSRMVTLRERVENDPTLFGLLAEARGFEVLVASRPKPKSDGIEKAHEAYTAATTAAYQYVATATARLSVTQRKHAEGLLETLDAAEQAFCEAGGDDAVAITKGADARRLLTKRISKARKG